MSSPCRNTQNLNVDQGALERVLLAMKILRANHDSDTEDRPAHEEVDELKSHLGDQAANLSLDQIAYMVIEREAKCQDENHL